MFMCMPIIVMIRGTFHQTLKLILMKNMSLKKKVLSLMSIAAFVAIMVLNINININNHSGDVSLSNIESLVYGVEYDDDNNPQDATRRVEENCPENPMKVVIKCREGSGDCEVSEQVPC